MIRPNPDLYDKSKLGKFVVHHAGIWSRNNGVWHINKGSINKTVVKCVINCIFKRLIIFGICQTVTPWGGSENISMVPPTCRWMWTLLQLSKRLYRPQWDIGAENPVKTGKSLISLSIPLACILFHLLEMCLCSCRGWGPTKGIGMFLSPNHFHWF